MSFAVEFHKISDPVNCVNKTVDNSTLIKIVQGDPIEDEDILNPSFLLNYYPELLECNYCYIAIYNRYYFCSVVTENANNIRVNCDVDALTTYWNQYNEQDMTLVRSTSFEKPTYVQDQMLPIDDERMYDILVQEFDSIHNGGNRSVDSYIILNSV